MSNKKKSNKKSKPTKVAKPQQSKEQSDEKWIPNPPDLDGVPDLSQLIYLDMPNVLRNLKYRYCSMSRKFCYTSVSSVLLAINPYEFLPIYGADVINEFHIAAKKGRLSQNRPHPFGVSARAYVRMVQRKCNQSVIVCGESGAGKTETTKLLMRYLAMTAPSAPSASTSISSTTTSSIEEQIIAASPILEAYGNAKTVMNNNSSRFGKFTKLLYNVAPKSQNGIILGSTLETYLLEKSRVVYQAINERNYHIFYFLHYGINKNKYAEYGLDSIDKFSYINQGKCFNSMKDTERFKELCESLSLYRIDTNIQNILWKLTSGVMNLGNINFIRTADGFTAINPKDNSFKHLDIVSKLWEINRNDLEKRLTTSSVVINRNNIIKNILYDNAISNRDSISKGIYENIFLWLAKRINAELLTDNDDINEDSQYFIGILDVFGFENFYINSLEQFCINYTNEKLQQYFNYHIIRSEQEEYLNESVFWKPLTIPDNDKYIKLVEDKSYGFFTLLDSCCKGPSKNDTVAFTQQLFKKHTDNPTIFQRSKPGDGNCRGQKPRRNNRRNRGTTPKFSGFMIKHFADDVCYDVSKFLIKNMESVHNDTNKMIKKSNQLLFKQINGVHKMANKSARRAKRAVKKSVTAVFHAGIKKLMRNLNKTEPYFVRCVNPNKQKSSKVWNQTIVEHQLRCGGLLEALRVLTLGYPTRVPYKLLYEKYHGSVTNKLIKNMNEEAFSTSLLIAFDVNEDDYELGLTKIFFKPSKAAVLDTIMSQAGKPLTPEQNDKITKYIVKKRIKQIVGTAKSYIKLQKLVRLKRAQKNWQYAGRVASLLGGTVFKHLQIARNRIQKRKEKEAAILMQTYFRSKYERNNYVKRIDKVKKSIKTVWISYNNMKQRDGLTKWLDKKVKERRIETERKIQIEAERIKKEKAKAIAAANIAKQDAASAAVKQDDNNKTKQLQPTNNKNDERKQQPIKPVLSREEQLQIARAAARKKADEDAKLLQKEIELQRKKQDSINENDKKQSDQDDKKLKKLEREKQAAQNLLKRQKEEEKLREYKKIINKKKKLKNKYGSKAVFDFEHEQLFDDDIIDDGDDYESDPDDVEDDLPSMLSRFKEISAMGQLFYRHTGTKRRNKPQDRVVKVVFSGANGKPSELSWGSGSRHILFKDILYISWGHYTPAFEARKDKLDAKKCFSVVGKSQILDLEGYNHLVAELWVKGLRKLVGHSDKKSDKLAQTNLKNLLQHKKDNKIKYKEQQSKLKSIMNIQKDLFIMSTHTVFRILEEERIWNIDDNIRNMFRPLKLYEIALKQDIPWRQWQQWIREQITTYLRNNNGVNAPFSNQIQPVPVFPPPPQHVNNNSMSNIPTFNNNMGFGNNYQIKSQPVHQPQHHHHVRTSSIYSKQPTFSYTNNVNVGNYTNNPPVQPQPQPQPQPPPPLPAVAAFNQNGDGQKPCEIM